MASNMTTFKKTEKWMLVGLKWSNLKVTVAILDFGILKIVQSPDHEKSLDLDAQMFSSILEFTACGVSENIY